jgi:putative hydrolase of the HAD superfamily
MYRPLGIIFDLGDTVLHLESVDVLAGNRCMLEFDDVNPGVTAEDVMAVVNEIFPWIEHARDTSMLEVTASSINRLIYETLGVTFRIDYDELETVFWNGALTYKPAEGIFELLDMLDTYGIKTGILSNSINRGGALEDELAKHDLAERFSFVMSSADYGIRKPHEYIFRIAIKKMGLEPSDIWFIGDNVEYDIRGALNAGLYPVWYNWRNESVSMDNEVLEIRSMQELQEKIKSFHNTK